MTAPAPVHPLPPIEEDVDLAFSDTFAATTPPPVRVVRRPWLLSAMLEDIYRGAWALPSDPELDASLKLVAALANGQPTAATATIL